MKKKLNLLVAVGLTGVLFLSACSNTTDNPKEKMQNEEMMKEEMKEEGMMKEEMKEEGMMKEEMKEEEMMK
jgi:pentapeptide MXKDX repeat protein